MKYAHPANQHAVDIHIQAIMVLTEAKEVTVLAVDDETEMLSELRRILFERFAEATYGPKTHRPVAIMAADREPGDAAKAVEDVVMGNADAARVFDAVGEAFGRLKDGDHVDLSISINRDRVSMDHYAPPREGESVLGTIKSFEPAMRGVSAAAATALEARPLAKFSLGQIVYERAGEGYRKVIVTGIAHYRHSPSSMQVEDLDPQSERASRWWDQEALFESVPDE